MKKRTQGMNWISQSKRLAIYLRDGMACVYCSKSVTEGIKLTLDHLKPYAAGGENKKTNLVTCCSVCNSKKGAMDYRRFISVFVYLKPISERDLIQKIRKTLRKKLDTRLANSIISEAGSCLKYIQSKKRNE